MSMTHFLLENNRKCLFLGSPDDFKEDDPPCSATSGNSTARLLKRSASTPHTRCPCTSTEIIVEVKGKMAIDLPQGTLDLLILKTLDLAPQHGWAISNRIQQVSNDVVRVQQGSLYPALYRLERRGWIRAKWATTENNRRARYYELTRTGRAQLRDQVESWRELAAAMARILEGNL
jgi:transcriptional regulator